MLPNTLNCVCTSTSSRSNIDNHDVVIDLGAIGESNQIIISLDFDNSLFNVVSIAPCCEWFEMQSDIIIDVKLADSSRKHTRVEREWGLSDNSEVDS